MNNINQYLAQSDALRFKLLAIVGENPSKKEKIIAYLESKNWHGVDVEEELLSLRDELSKQEEDSEIQIGGTIKRWFQSQPNQLILKNPSILYHELFLKMSPIGAFKYNSRNKNCVLFLEEDQMLGRRLSHGSVGTHDFYDQEINDILMVNIEDISDNFTSVEVFPEFSFEDGVLDPEAIGNYFNFQEIKDVVDIDSDLQNESSQQAMIQSYVVSERLENQIVAFFENLDKPTHKAASIIGNYGSGKSHMIAFLISLINYPQHSALLENPNIAQAVSQVNRQFLTVQFELQAGQVTLKKWFFEKIRQQLKAKYQLKIPVFDPETQFDDKENIESILSCIKSKKGANCGLLVVIDEISDFLSAKQREAMLADIQFLRVIGQVCQAQDLMFVGSMQEDIFSSPKFKNVAAGLGRVSQRFQEIIIHKEDIKKVISSRIVSKKAQQRHDLEKKLRPYAAKVEEIERNIEAYIDIFPLTPFLLELFNDLPYFEKRGVIQFAMKEIKKVLNQPFPYFISFERIYDVLENNPNKKNLPEIFEVTKVVHILLQKIKLLDEKFHADAIKIVKALATLSLWNKEEKGATAKELANYLMLLPQNKHFSAEDHISLVIKKIREVTDGAYIKVRKDESTNSEYFRFNAVEEVDPEEKIAQKVVSVSDSEVEHELFHQCSDLLELQPMPGESDVYDDECRWNSTKSFRKGIIAFFKDSTQFGTLPERDYAVIFISPYAKNFKHSFATHQLTLQLSLNTDAHLQQLKEIIAIKELINSNVMKSVMLRKLEQRIHGGYQGKTPVTGFKHHLAKLLIHKSKCTLNGKPESIKKHLIREHSNLCDILDAFKESVFDELFNQKYPLHVKYPKQLSSANIVLSLSSVASDLARGQFDSLAPNTKQFLQSLNLLDSSGYPEVHHSKIALELLNTLKTNQNKVTEIQKELVHPLVHSEYGLEPEIIHLILVLLTVQGKIFLQLRGGEKISINNIKEKLKSLALFESIPYAKIQENFSYDFAERLFHTLGINGAKIKLEKERLSAFKDYKIRVKEVLNEIQGLKKRVEDCDSLVSPIPMQAIKEELLTIEAMNWEILEIKNHTQFAVIESQWGNQLASVTLKLQSLKILSHALKDYQNHIHESLQYMSESLKLLEDFSILVSDSKKLKSLQALHQEVLHIVSDYTRFTDFSHRNPIAGKTQKFKQSYIYDFYFPVHEKQVGNKVDWKQLHSYKTFPVFQKLTTLHQLSCIASNRLNRRILEWNQLENFRCTHANLEVQLQRNIRCPRCAFPQSGRHYSTITSRIASIEETLEQFLKEYNASILKSIREYRDNLQFLNSDEERKRVEDILKTKKFPEFMDALTLKAINQLFKEIDIQEVEAEEVIHILFPQEQMMTLEDLRKAFFNWENSLKKNKVESEVRIRLK